MAEAKEMQLRPESILEEMKKNRVTDVVFLPDSETITLYQLLAAEPSLRLISVNREASALHIAAGLHAGGRTPIVLIQNTGLLECGDTLRGWVMGMNMPVVLLVGYRGWKRHGVTKDTAAVYTERFLHALGLNFYLVETTADASLISVACAEAQAAQRPVVVLVAG